jgi:polyphosphate kinase 2 (PPK2 family)
MTGVNPQAVQVRAFKQPSARELDQDFLWRYQRAVPGRGRIGIFNRSQPDSAGVADHAGMWPPAGASIER